MTPPTWRELERRARRLGLAIEHGLHEAQLYGADMEVVFGAGSWLGRRADALILRTAVAAALEQPKRNR